METAAIIQLVAIGLPYLIKALEQAKDLEEIKEFAACLKRLSENDDVFKVLKLTGVIK